MDLGKDAKEFDKLQATPIQVEFNVGKENFKAWLHALTDPQTIHCISVYGEQFEILHKDGQDEDRSHRMATFASDMQVLAYAVKTGERKDSPRAFNRVGEVLRVDQKDRLNMLDLYTKTFDMTQEQVGNSLRARIDSSSMRSNLPAISPVN